MRIGHELYVAQTVEVSVWSKPKTTLAVSMTTTMNASRRIGRIGRETFMFPVQAH